MLRHPLAYSPLTLTDEAEVSVKLKLLAGHHLGSGDIVVDLLVHGHPLDETAGRWSSSPAAGPHPHWPDGGEQVMLTVRMPQLAVLQVKTIILIFTGPRCLWGPVYGSRCLYVRTYDSFVKLC